MKKVYTKIGLLFLLFFPCFLYAQKDTGSRSPVDYVNPYIGNISHLLVPTYPTVHLPNSMLRVYPNRESFTSDLLEGLPVIVPGHRRKPAFSLSPFQGSEDEINGVISLSYDNEIIKPYYYSADVGENNIHVEFAPSHQSAIYGITFAANQSAYLIVATQNGSLERNGNSISGFQYIDDKTQVFLYLETDTKFTTINNTSEVNGDSVFLSLKFPPGTKKIKVRYGVSFISVEQAKKNLVREIMDYDLSKIALVGKETWNSELGKIKIEGGSHDDKVVFYTSLYRICERMVCISEDRKYYSGYDHKVHDDGGIPFYVDDWIWDTYRATHPLRLIIDTKKETDILNSYIRMACQRENHWMPTFPEVQGDTHRMNGNHGVATVIDAYNKGVRNFDLNKAYVICKAAITEKTLAPWSGAKAGVLDDFFRRKGYFPALAPNEQETVSEVNSWEKRQPVAVTLGTVYDEWCLGQIAEALGKREEAAYFLKRSLDYHKIFNSKTKFFHPKDSFGNFIEPFDYRYSGGLGARNAYDENNGWVYRWDVPHNIADLIRMMGGNESFVNNLDKMFSMPLGMSRWQFYGMLPDQTGNVGQFSMGNEPAMHIPYLYNYAGQPWRTQKRVRSLLTQWFRNDLMGIPGDEDGGGLTSFVVFSQMGFYPVTPGLPMYVIGSPIFKSVVIKLENGKSFKIICHNYSPENKYIQSAKLNGRDWNKSWFSHNDLMKGGKLEFVMGKYPNKHLASTPNAIPPSFTFNNNKNE